MAAMRRSLGFVVIVLTAASTLIGSAGSVRADEKTEDHGSKANFKFICEAGDGRFVQGQYGDTYCYYSDGSWENCDSHGNDCWFIPKPLTNPGPEPIDNLDDLDVAPDNGQSNESPAADTADPTSQVTAGSAQTVDEQADEAPQKKAKDKHKKKNKRTKR